MRSMYAVAHLEARIAVLRVVTGFTYSKLTTTSLITGEVAEVPAVSPALEALPVLLDQLDGTRR